MASADTVFTRLADGTLLLRQADGSYRPIASETDHDRIDRLTDDEIERMAASDPDHPALDDAFWASIDKISDDKESLSLELDRDVVAFFRRQGQGFQNRINEVLRDYINLKQKAG
jgi:uncharacterized protein (DUF4415 family)